MYRFITNNMHKFIKKLDSKILIIQQLKEHIVHNCKYF